jgi:metallo-beta-lactamase family protein
MKLTFLGAAGTVTGSLHLVETNGHRILLDCGLYQGQKDLRIRNWSTRVPDPASVDAIVLSHAHLDHCGYLPLLVRQGFRGPIHCTSATKELLAVVLLDAAHLQEEEAERANRYQYSKHHPALPLYTVADAELALTLASPQPYDVPFSVSGGATVRLRRAGHILGSATVELEQGGGPRLVYSGDLGRYGRPVLADPAPVPAADVLLLESTYGNRTHPGGAEQDLAQIVRDASVRGGTLLIPAFAVDRTQELLWILRTLERAGTIPTLPVYCDSPMATEVTDIYSRHLEDCDADVAASLKAGDRSFATGDLHIVRTVADSRHINDVRGAAIIIASSGMATGGRILHHLALRLPDPRTTVLLVGYQAPGTRGRAQQEGAREIRIFGEPVAVRARVAEVTGLSAHADRDEMLRWLGGFTSAPRMTYLVHGEPAAASALATMIQDRLGWNVVAAAEGQQVDLAAVVP